MAISSFNDSFTSTTRYAKVASTTGSPVIGTETIDGIDFLYHIFKGSGSITFSLAGLCDVFAVAGGGAGGRGSANAGGGGGGGGFWQFYNYPVLMDSYTVTVGNGGAATSADNTAGGDGGSSFFGSFEIKGGGGGGGTSGFGRTGGCAGGNGDTHVYSTTVFSDTSTLTLSLYGTNVRYGQIGGGGESSGTAANRSGGGGGGANIAGVNSGNLVGGSGGAGKLSKIISTTVATAESVGVVSGSDVFFSGGGGGSQNNNNVITGLGGLSGFGTSTENARILMSLESFAVATVSANTALDFSPSVLGEVLRNCLGLSFPPISVPFWIPPHCGSSLSTLGPLSCTLPPSDDTITL